MYEAHWGLQESPFRETRDPRFFFCSPSHDEALARMQFLADQQRRLGVLLGAAGVGKSRVLQVLTDRLRRQGRDVALLSAQARDLPEFLWQLAAQLGCNPASTSSEGQLWRRVTENLGQRRMLRTPVLVLIDDAESAAPELQAGLLRLLHGEGHPENWATYVLAADSERYRKLDQRLLELAELRMDLEPWTTAETQAYLQFVSRSAGAVRELFQKDAMVRLHDAAQGVPRRVAQLADLVLLAGAGQGLDMIDERTVDCVHLELCVC